ncbi:MAG: hypothetical protein HRU26_01090 [Psychroserpens sp.]|nr:hypothetical protein [Psychroserpens sp.]
MKLLSRLFVLLLFIQCFLAQGQEQKEILIVGDMHQVPGIVKRAYKPMVKRILKYDPQLIMAEYSRKGDTAAMGSWNEKFKEAYLKEKETYKDDTGVVDGLLAKPNSELDSLEFRDLQTFFLSVGDQANHRMYGYFAKHGVDEKFKPYGNQNPDLTFQLMRKLELKTIFGVDSHEGYQGYWPAWQRALRAGSEEGKKAYKKAMRKDTWGNIFAGLSGSLGRRTNNPKTLDAYYRINSLRFEGFSGENYNIQIQKWDNRNINMAKNILEVLNNNTVKRSVLIVGAGHAKAVSEALKELDPNVKVIMYHDLKAHLKTVDN